MKLVPFGFKTTGDVSHAENSQFKYERVGSLAQFTFKTENVSIRPVKTLIKELERLSSP